MKQMTCTVLLALLLLQIQFCTNSEVNLEDVILQVNREHKTDINVFINLRHDGNKSQMDTRFNEALHNLSHLPKLVETSVTGVKKLHGSFSERSLTVAWMNWENINSTFSAIDRLLIQRHFTNIIFVFHNPINLSQELMYIFQLCWKLGLTSTMIWTDAQLFTYHPYPSIEVRTLNNISHFGDKTHLDNFHQYEWDQPTIQFPPRFFSYTNRKGQKVYGGYLYNLIYLFLSRHNASINYFFYDMWASDVSSTFGLQRCLIVKPCALSPLLFDYDDSILLPSSTPFLTKVVFLVPSAHEISNNLYLGLPFDVPVWLIVIFSGFLYFILMNILRRQRKSTRINIDWGLAFLDAFKIIMFLPASQPSRRSFLEFSLNLLYLFTGVFLTNYYSTSLWSMYTAKLYEPELELVADIERTNLDIFIYTLDMPSYDRLESLPSFIRERFYAGNETVLAQYRQNLNMTYLYTAIEDLADYLLLQQKYLKQPFANKLSEPFYTRPFFLPMIPRSPLFEQFNRYLFRIFESGILDKFIDDSYWEGIMSGELRLLRDAEVENEPLTLIYFQYAFVALSIGWFTATVVFLVEIACNRNKGNVSENSL